MINWTVTFTSDGTLDEATFMQLQENIDDHGIDGAISAQPNRGQWSASFGVDAESPDAALHDARTYAEEAAVPVDHACAVGIVTLAELERQAAEPTLPTLVGASEVGEMLSVSRQRVHQLRSHPSFPAPLVEVAMGPLWDARAVRAFVREWKRAPGRPSKAAG